MIKQHTSVMWHHACMQIHAHVLPEYKHTSKMSTHKDIIQL